MTEQAQRLPINPQSRIATGKARRPLALIGNRYQVVNRLVGGMGMVHLCNDRITHDLVALKTFKPEYTSSALPAICSCAKEPCGWRWANTPNIVQAYQSGLAICREVHSCPRMRCSSLSATHPLPALLAAQRQTLPWNASHSCSFHYRPRHEICHQKLPGLSTAIQTRKHPHRRQNGQARVTDFGLASTHQPSVKRAPPPLWMIYSGTVQRTPTHSGAAGTPLYMAPEQWLQLKTGRPRRYLSPGLYLL